MPEIQVNLTLTTQTCKRCGGFYAITPDYIEEAKRLGGFRQLWACPYCKTTWGYGESEEEKKHAKQQAELQQRLDQQTRAYQTERRLNEELKVERDTEIQRADKMQRSRNGLRGTLAKERKKIAAGTCPCCNEYFSTLAVHMEGAHPDYAKQKTADEQDAAGEAQADAA